MLTLAVRLAMGIGYLGVAIFIELGFWGRAWSSRFGVAGVVVVGGVKRRRLLPGGRRRPLERPVQAAEDGGGGGRGRGGGSAAVPGHGERRPALPSSGKLCFPWLMILSEM